MKKIISFRQAIQWSQILFGLLILFHLSIIMGMVLFDYTPIDFLWGGRMETREQLLGFEIISLSVMVLCFLIVLIRAERIRIPALMGVARISLWILSVLFLVNTLGNILANTAFEKFFAIITAILVILCLRLALETPTKNA
jgi:hypothetical protein